PAPAETGAEARQLLAVERRVIPAVAAAVVRRRRVPVGLLVALDADQLLDLLEPRVPRLLVEGGGVARQVGLGRVTELADELVAEGAHALLLQRRLARVLLQGRHLGLGLGRALLGLRL